MSERLSGYFTKYLEGKHTKFDDKDNYRKYISLSFQYVTDNIGLFTEIRKYYDNCRGLSGDFRVYNIIKILRKNVTDQHPFDDDGQFSEVLFYELNKGGKFVEGVFYELLKRLYYFIIIKKRDMEYREASETYVNNNPDLVESVKNTCDDLLGPEYSLELLLKTARKILNKNIEIEGPFIGDNFNIDEFNRLNSDGKIVKYVRDVILVRLEESIGSEESNL